MNTFQKWIVGLLLVGLLLVVVLVFTPSLRCEVISGGTWVDDYGCHR